MRTIEKYKKHPSIKAIADISKNDNFILEKISYEEILHEKKSQIQKKASQSTDVPSKIFKMNSDIFAVFFIDILATPLQHQCFRRILKTQI